MTVTNLTASGMIGAEQAKLDAEMQEGLKKPKSKLEAQKKAESSEPESQEKAKKAWDRNPTDGMSAEGVQHSDTAKKLLESL